MPTQRDLMKQLQEHLKVAFAEFLDTATMAELHLLAKTFEHRGGLDASPEADPPLMKAFFHEVLGDDLYGRVEERVESEAAAQT